ncbi:MAG: hypothetical protein ACRYG7_34540 [Janthinobacterium lividum]
MAAAGPLSGLPLAGRWGRHARLGVALLAGLAGCGGDPRAGHYIGDDITRTDFEEMAGWGADEGALTRAHAHSGQFATFVGPTREFSLTYQLPLGQASVHTLRAVDLDAWVYAASPRAGAALTVQVFRPPGSPAGPPLYSEALHVGSTPADAGTWHPVHHVFVLPSGLPGDAQLRIFLWRDAGSEPVYLDDLHAKARE